MRSPERSGDAQILVQIVRLPGMLNLAEPVLAASICVLCNAIPHYWHVGMTRRSLAVMELGTRLEIALRNPGVFDMRNGLSHVSRTWIKE